jgi:hypothetical protein
MQRLYGEFTRDQKLRKLDPHKVPVELWPWIPYAELWGIEDDYFRDEFVSSAPQVAKDDLVAAVREINAELNKWLAGEEASSPTPSDEYCAFTCMRMAADEAS